MQKLKFGLDDLHSNSFGPLVSKEHLESVKNYIEMSEGEGAKVLVDGRDFLKEKILIMVIFLVPLLLTM